MRQGAVIIIAAFPAGRGFRVSGWLSFFYFDGSIVGGVEVVGTLFADTADGAHAIYTAADDGYEAEPLSDADAYPKVEVAAELVLTWPTWELPRLHRDGRPVPRWEQVFAVVEQIRTRGRLLTSLAAIPTRSRGRWSLKSPMAWPATAGSARSAGPTRR